MAEQRANWCFHAIVAQKECSKLQQRQQQQRLTPPIHSHSHRKRNEYISLGFVSWALIVFCVCAASVRLYCICVDNWLLFLTFHLNFSPSSVSEKRATCCIFNAFRLPNSIFYNCIVCNSCNLHIHIGGTLVSCRFFLPHTSSILNLTAFALTSSRIYVHECCVVCICSATRTPNLIKIHFRMCTRRG